MDELNAKIAGARVSRPQLTAALIIALQTAGVQFGGSEDAIKRVRCAFGRFDNAITLRGQFDGRGAEMTPVPESLLSDLPEEFADRYMRPLAAQLVGRR